ncbi:MAG: hypothetical protein QM820_13120 [Minicystis sp.]
MMAILVLAGSMALVPACGTRSQGTGDGGSETATAGAGDAAAPVDRLEVFLEAARTDLARPYPGARAGSRERYAEAAGSLVDAVPLKWDSAQIVAEVLARSSDPRAARALMDWAAAPATADDHRFTALASMRLHPRTEYLETVAAILARDELAGVIVPTYSGAYCAALEVGARVSLHEIALEVAAAVPGEDGRALLRRIAGDRAASAPNPRTLAALSCEGGKARVESEAQAIASLRIMALSLLRDEALMRKIGEDAGELPLVRTWATRMAKGKPAHRDARAARAWVSVAGEAPVPQPFLAPSPCP